MSRVVAELTLEPGTRLQTLPAAVPAEVIRYARGMLQEPPRDSLRFLWRHERHLALGSSRPHSIQTPNRLRPFAARPRGRQASGCRSGCPRSTCPAASRSVRSDVLTLLALGLTNSRNRRAARHQRPHSVRANQSNYLTKLDQGAGAAWQRLRWNSGLLLRLQLPVASTAPRVSALSSWRRWSTRFPAPRSHRCDRCIRGSARCSSVR